MDQNGADFGAGKKAGNTYGMTMSFADRAEHFVTITSDIGHTLFDHILGQEKPLQYPGQNFYRRLEFFGYYLIDPDLEEWFNLQ